MLERARATARARARARAATAPTRARRREASSARARDDARRRRATTKIRVDGDRGARTRARATKLAWRGAERAPEGSTTRRAAEAFVARWEAAGARASALPAAMTSMRPGKDAAAKLSVENAVYESDVFRKMHCELAWGDGGFEVLHVVMYPWAERAAPVFAADVVGFGGRVSLCIADVAPVTKDLSLPRSYVDALAPELERALGDGLTRRELPDWGRAILGPLCLCVGPKVGDDARADVDAFFRYAFKLHDANCALASAPELILPSDSSVALDAQVRFCERQLENVKTRRALERAFGVDLTDRYMRQVLFDVTPSTPRRPS